MPRLAAFEGYWSDHPPVHHLVAAYLGYKPPEAPKGIDDFMKAMGHG